MSKTTIPIGFLFAPTDEILINDYLLNKILGKSLPYEGIIERNLYGSDPPWQILGDDVPWIATENNKKCVYVFTHLKYMSETCRNRMSRTAGCGSWMGKSVGKIVDGTGELIGKTEMLVFESSDESLVGTRGYWLMHEYALAGSSLDSVRGQSLDQTYVVCKITKHESKLLKIVPKKSVSRKGKTYTIKSDNKRKTDATKNGISKTSSSHQEFCFDLENGIAKSGLELDNVTKENEGSQEFETQYSQEWSSLTLPSHEYALAGSSLDFVRGKSLDKTYVVGKITKHGSKLLKIVPKKSVSRKEKTNNIKPDKKRKIDAAKNGISKMSSSHQEFCFDLENDIAKSGLELDNVTKENEGSQEFETQYSQEWSSLALPSVGIEDGGFQTQDYNEILYNYESYGDDFFGGWNDMFNTDELLSLLEADEPTKRQRQL